MKKREPSGYFPERLLEKLRRARDHSLSIIVAPTGYGKTRAIERMAAEIPEGTFFWFTAVWENAKSDWERLCQLVSRFNPRAAEELLALSGSEPVNVDAALTALDLLKAPEGQEIYLVLDHFNEMMALFPPVVLGALFRMRQPGLHLVLMGHPFQVPMRVAYDPYAINWIGTKDLAFTPQDIKAYYAEAGIALHDGEAELIHSQTGGWPAAVAAHLEMLLKNPGSKEPPPMSTLLAQVFFDRLETEERLLMKSLSQFSAVTETDISLLTAPGETAGQRTALLLRVPLMRYDPGKQTFTLPPVLQAFLASRLENSPQQERLEVYRRLGRRHTHQGQTAQAIGCYFAIKDYEAILSLELKLLVFARAGKYPIEVVAQDIIENCSMDIKRKHPLSLIRLAYILFGCGEYVKYDLAMAQARDMIDPETSPQLYGEWLLISMIRYLPDLEKMSQIVLEASEYLKSPPQALSEEEPFLFGCPSMWYLFYHTPGQGDLIADQLEQLLRSYDKIFAGRGVGAALLYRGELASMRGELEKSNAYAHSAAALGEEARQVTVVYGAALLMARNAIAVGDFPRAQHMLDYLDEKSALFPALEGTAINHQIQETVRSLILSLMRELGVGGELIIVGHRTQYADSLLAQMTLHIRVLDLIVEQKPEKALALMEATLIRNERLCNTVMRYMINLGIAMFYMEGGYHQEALHAMQETLEIAYEDRLMISLVNHREALRPLLRSPALSKYQNFITAIYAYKKQRAGKPEAEVQNLGTLPSSLSPREQEVAVLASQGLRNAEIAQRLFITESTVKKHMQMVFEKLHIDRRAKLIDLLKR